MKFPKSVHAEGWIDQFDKTAPEHMPEALATGPTAAAVPRPRPRPVSAEAAGVNRPRVYTSTAAPAPTFSAPASPVIVAPKRSSATPWIIGGGLAVVAIAAAVTMSHNMPSRDATTLPPTVTGEAKPSPEDAQLAAAPTAAGPVTPETTQAATQAAAEPPAATPAPVIEPKPTVVAAAPAMQAPAPKVERAPTPQPVPQPAPVARTMTPQPETLAQASPPPVTLRDPVMPVVPAAPTVAPPATLPEQVNPTPVVPPVAQAQPQPAPELAVAEDAGVTVKVKTALATDAVLSAVPIAVSTDHGVVKLEGQVPDPQARERATVVAAATLGVKAVDNRLTLPPVALLQQQLEPQQVARASGN